MLALITDECQNYTDTVRKAQEDLNITRRPDGRSQVGCIGHARLAAAFACALLSASAAAQPERGVPEQVRAALQRAGLPLSSASILVQDIGRAEPSLAWRAGEATLPASAMKLVTTFAALDELGPAYTWKTEVYASAAPRDEAVDDLYVKGYGDPTLSLERFWSLVSDLRQRGIRHIRGDLVLDDSWFAAPAADAGAFDGQPERAYNIPPRALMVGLKATGIRLVPETGAARPRLVRMPDIPEIAVQNDVELRPGACPADWSAGLERSVSGVSGAAVVRVSGKYASDCGEHTLYVNALDNATYIHAVFRKLWTDLGGTPPARVRSASVPPGAQLLLTFTSQSLAEAVRDTNKNSSNIMARQILLTLAAERGGPPATERAGAEAVRDWIIRRGLAFPELRIENGSGLSRVERISALHLGQLLVAAARSPWMPELAASLPIAGLDGTMQRRLKNSPVAGQARIKTGSIDGVKSIAGYVQDRSGRWSAVVFIVNHADASSAGPAQDALLEWAHDRNP